MLTPSSVICKKFKHENKISLLISIGYIQFRSKFYHYVYKPHKCITLSLKNNSSEFKNW